MSTKREKIEQVKIIRDHVLPLMREKSNIVDIDGIKTLTWNTPPWSFCHRTPFGPIPVPNTYEGARLWQRRLNLGYSLDIWYDHKKVFNIEWDQPAEPEIVCFKRGEWENELAALCGISSLHMMRAD